MQRKESIYVTKRDTCLSNDPIIPYGGNKKTISSNKENKQVILELLSVFRQNNS